MATFTSTQQLEHRTQFIEECRQKAWGAACHAEWISKNMDRLHERYNKLHADDTLLKGDLEKIAADPDKYSPENRAKKRDIESRREQLAADMKAIAPHAQEGQKALMNLRNSIESALELAKHAETWTWKEVEAEPEEAPAE